MIFEVATVEEGENPEDVVLRVHYWHEVDRPDKGNPRRPNREPDYVEDHVIIGVPPERYPLRTPMGQYIGIDGQPVMEMDLGDDGELTSIDPYDIEDRIQWGERNDDEVDDLLISPAKERAVQVRQNGLRGRDTFSDDRRPKPKKRRTVTTTKSVASRRRDRIVGHLGRV